MCCWHAAAAVAGACCVRVSLARPSPPPSPKEAEDEEEEGCWLTLVGCVCVRALGCFSFCTGCCDFSAYCAGTLRYFFFVFGERLDPVVRCLQSSFNFQKRPPPTQYHPKMVHSKQSADVCDGLG
uniref:Putative secreted protein n=1 Tax=Anopheles triannulatus TaxID=58253 RepID=A0A2M4B6W9_9DIPT